MHRLVRCFLAAGVVLAGVTSSSAAGREVVRLEDVEDGDIATAAFRLSRPVRVRVECEGAGHEKRLDAYGWILDARTRDVAWALTPATAGLSRKGEFAFAGDLNLPAGRYIAHYAAFADIGEHTRTLTLFGKKILNVRVKRDRDKHAAGNRDRWMLRVVTRSESDSDAVEFDDGSFSDPLLLARLAPIGDGALERRTLRVTQSAHIIIDALGEQERDRNAMMDLGWILDATTRQPVWEMVAASSAHAGGAEKNRRVRAKLQLPPGNYEVFYSSDDSHSADSWNAAPPYDPDSWGITLLAAAGADAARVVVGGPSPEPKPVVALLRQSSNAYGSIGFELPRAARLRVRALGEVTRDENLVDYGWIENLASRQHVWEMDGRRTRPAGGAAKNRAADDIVSLPAGKYALYYSTDDSHAYHDWNATPPYVPEDWGIALYPLDKESISIRTFAPEAEEETSGRDLVRLTRATDDADLEQRFHLDRATRVRIIALGEGLDREMFDYGWIENARGEAVWEMTIRNSRHAGGAAKNRVFDGVILLDRGDYVARFVTDGSHAWGSWNAERPPAPHRWGIRLLPAE